MTIWNIIALVIGIIATLACLALAIFGALVFLAVLTETKEILKEVERDR